MLHPGYLPDCHVDVRAVLKIDFVRAVRVVGGTSLQNSCIAE